MRSFQTTLVAVAVLSACTTGADDVAVTTTPPSTAVETSTTDIPPTPTTVEVTTTTVGPTTTTTASGLIEVTVVGGVVAVSGVTEVAVGDEVRIRVTSDAADELHVHTYDLLVDVEPGTPVDVTFVAAIPGIHEVELEVAAITLLELEVGG